MGPRANAGLDDVLMLVVVFALIAFAVALVIAIFYLLTLHKALSRVAPHNRLMEPALVWLDLIPCVNLVWQFFIAIRVPDSLRNEFRERGMDDGSDYGKAIALTRAILSIAGGVGGNLLTRTPELKMIGSGLAAIAGLIELVLFIVFWVKIANYSNRLATEGGDFGDYRRKFDDYDDGGRDYPRGGAPSPPPETYKPEDPGQYH